MKYFYSIFLSALFLFPLITNAESGACSWHGGVDCDRGRQIDGRVYCNDGWTDSITYYDFTKKCDNQYNSYCWFTMFYLPETYVELEDTYQVEEKRNIALEKFNESTQALDDCSNSIDSSSRDTSNMTSEERLDYLAEMKSKNDCLIDVMKLQGEYDTLNTSYLMAKDMFDNQCDFAGRLGYLNYYDDLVSCKGNFQDGYCVSYNETCQNKYGINSHGDEEYCYCNDSYEWNNDKTECVKKQPCLDMVNGYFGNDGKCYCNSGYTWDSVNSKCIVQPIVISNSTDDIKNFVTEEKNKLSVVDDSLTSRLKGKILLQVENKGQAWYVNPKDGKRHYMADGGEAYRIMRELGVGITNVDLDKVKSDTDFAKKHSGKIFLQVEDLGQAFYINFDGTAHYLKDGNEAYNIMRDLGLGITNNDLNKIDIEI